MLSVKVSPEKLRAAKELKSPAGTCTLESCIDIGPHQQQGHDEETSVEASEGEVPERVLPERKGRGTDEEPGVQEGGSGNSFKKMSGTTAVEGGQKSDKHICRNTCMSLQQTWKQQTASLISEILVPKVSWIKSFVIEA